MGRILEPPPKARGNGARCAEHQPQRHGEATRFGDHSATLGIRTCCGWSFGHSRGPVVVPRSSLCSKVSFHKSYSQCFWIWSVYQSQHVGTMLLNFSKVVLCVIGRMSANHPANDLQPAM